MDRSGAEEYVRSPEEVYFMNGFIASDIALHSLTRIGQAYSLFLPRASSPSVLPGERIDPRQDWARRYLSWRYIRGSGIEIGALHQPLPLYRGAQARYLDRMSSSDLRRHYPELEKFELVEPEIIDDGESLQTIAPESQDFIIANHFIEHCEDPIGTIETHLSKLRSGGVLFLAVPMRDFTFDKTRALTTIEHLRRDHDQGPEISRAEHYLEWALHVEHKTDRDVELTARRLEKERYSIHFHVWGIEQFSELLQYLRSEMRFKFSLLKVGQWKYNPIEAIFVLRKS